MKSKNLIFLTLVFAIIVIGILATIFLLASTPVITKEKPPISNPVSSPTDTVIDINQGNVNNFDIAVINPDDTIDLKNTNLQRIPIQLTKMSWKNLNWSPDGKLLAVLGKTSQNIYDLFIFNLEKKSWTTATSFKQSSVGVDGYLWRDSNVILFTQGTSSEHWIHQYVYSSGEITKLNRTEGKLYTMSPDGKSMVVKLNENDDTTSFAFFKTDGTLFYNLSKVTDSKNQPLKVSNIVYTKNSNNIVLRTIDGKIFSHTFGNSNAIELTKAVKLIPLCGVNEKVVLGIKESVQDNEHSVQLSTFSIDNAESLSIAIITQDPNKVDFSKTKCYKLNNIALNLEGNWYLVKDANFFTFAALKSAVEVSFREI